MISPIGPVHGIEYGAQSAVPLTHRSTPFDGVFLLVILLQQLLLFHPRIQQFVSLFLPSPFLSSRHRRILFLLNRYYALVLSGTFHGAVLLVPQQRRLIFCRHGRGQQERPKPFHVFQWCVIVAAVTIDKRRSQSVPIDHGCFSNLFNSGCKMAAETNRHERCGIASTIAAMQFVEVTSSPIRGGSCCSHICVRQGEVSKDGIL
mmetsp:Transcript_31028/g.51678  ORF Transcript_31028/g.51678 Transcript_31028/m.51678 type:complete len:204 (-) Transcript_31028:1234-1845(-)